MNDLKLEPGEVEYGGPIRWAHPAFPAFSKEPADVLADLRAGYTDAARQKRMGPPTYTIKGEMVGQRTVFRGLWQAVGPRQDQPGHAGVTATSEGS